MSMIKRIGSVGLIVAGVLFVPAQAAPGEEPAVLQTATGELHGTLLVPAGAERPPVVFIHPGSGPTDRDGNNPAFRGPSDLAAQLPSYGRPDPAVDARLIAAVAAFAAALPAAAP